MNYLKVISKSECMIKNYTRYLKPNFESTYQDLFSAINISYKLLVNLSS